MDDEEDVKKMIDLIKSSQEDTSQDFQYDDFINCENSDIEEMKNENEDGIYFDNNYDFSNFTTTDISKLSTYDPRSILKQEERTAIDSCSDPELKNLLLLNRTKNFQLMQLYKKLKDLLIQCQKDMKEKRDVINNFLKANKDQAHSSGAWRLAAPYFKDKKLYACPPNADTLRKQRNKELSVYDVTVILKWSSLECDKLLRAVKVNYNINQQSDVLKKIRALKKSGNKDELGELERRMEELQDEDNSEIPPLNSDQYIDWMRVSEVFLQDRRNPFECKSFWHIYLHPEINKSPWTPEENSKLKNLVKKHRYQNWDKIAEELDTNRTGFTTCMNYYSNLHEKFKKGDFTYEEDSRLIELVYKHRMGNYIPWVKIVHHFKNRTRAQLHHRYTYYLTQNHKRKGKFTDAEDILLMILVDRFGKNFKKCSKYFPSRSMVQIKARYNSNLQQKLKKGSFTEEEDRIIMEFVEEHGQSWTKLTNVLHRCRGQIRQRFNTISAYLAKNPNSSLAVVPRRKHNLKEEEESFIFLRMVADQFRASPNIPSLQEIENVLRGHQQEESTENGSNNSPNIDNMLTNFFSNTFRMNSSKCISARYVKQAVKDVQVVLNALNVNLNIPHDFDEDIRLDNLDVAILNILSDKEIAKGNTRNDVCETLPPNLNSLVGMRGLLIKYHEDKSERQETESVDRERNRSPNAIKLDIFKELLSLSDDIRSNVENDRKLFHQRFHALFKWPAIMTLEGPSLELQGRSSCDLSLTRIQVKRTYSKADRSKTDKASERQMKICELPSSSTEATPLKLTPVTNKSIIEDLIRNKDKKLYRMKAVKSGSATNVVIKEVDFRSYIGATSSSGSSTNNCQGRKIKPVMSETDCCEPKNKRQKLSRFILGQEDCIMLDTHDDDYTEDSTESDDDLKDLDKLETFLNEQRYKDVPNEDDDLEDLKKLEGFLKLQEIDID